MSRFFCGFVIFCVLVPVVMLIGVKKNDASVLFKTRDTTNTLSANQIKTLQEASVNSLVAYRINRNIPTDIDISNRGVIVYISTNTGDVRIVGQRTTPEITKIGEKLEKELKSKTLKSNKNFLYNTISKYSGNIVALADKQVKDTTSDSSLIIPIFTN